MGDNGKGEALRGCLSLLFAALAVLAVGYGEIAGVYHSRAEHAKEDGWEALYIPPVAWYRSIEMIWHRSNDEVDVGMQDMGVAMKLYHRVSMMWLNKKLFSSAEIDESIDLLRRKYKSYTNSEKKVFVRYVDVYIELNMLYHDEMVSRLNTAADIDGLNFEPGVETKKKWKILEESGIDEDAYRELSETGELLKEMLKELHATRSIDEMSIMRQMARSLQQTKDEAVADMKAVKRKMLGE